MIHNPVIPGFYPDPSVCRVGDDFYLATSSFEYFPGVPLFHSTDLVDWRQIGHALTRDSQLPLQRCRRPLGIFAPTLRYIDGRFYLITTNTAQGLGEEGRPWGHFLVWTDDIHGEWSDPIWIDHPGIDPDLFLDDDGTVWFTCTGIAQAPIDLATGTLRAPVQRISAGCGGRSAEAPHIYRIGAYYYLMLAEGGTEREHMVTIQRGPSPSGPWEPCPRGPILSHSGKDADLAATGHADLIADAAGDWWLVFLATRPDGYQPMHHLGRETCLAPVTWVDDWPVVNAGEVVPLAFSARDREQRRPIWGDETIDFRAALDFGWNYRRNPIRSHYRHEPAAGRLGLCCAAPTVDGIVHETWIGRRQRHKEVRVTARLRFTPRPGEEAGLCVFMAERFRYDLVIRAGAAGRELCVRRTVASMQVTSDPVALADECVDLVIEADAAHYRLGFRDAEGDTRILVTSETRLLSTELEGGFTGVYCALFARGAEAEPSVAWCEAFTYRT